MSTTLNINTLAGSRTSWPHWQQRGKIKKVDPHGNLVPGEYAFAGEIVEISPRYQKHGQHFRVRPIRPAVFFAAFCFENGLLPEQLTPEECQQEWALQLLDPLWEQCKGYFHKLESPNAACDTMTVPSHRVGFSFNILQVLVDPIGAVKNAAGATGPHPLPVSAIGSTLDAAKKKIEEMRARTPAAPTSALPPTPRAKK